MIYHFTVVADQWLHGRLSALEPFSLRWRFWSKLHGWTHELAFLARPA